MKRKIFIIIGIIGIFFTLPSEADIPTDTIIISESEEGLIEAKISESKLEIFAKYLRVIDQDISNVEISVYFSAINGCLSQAMATILCTDGTRKNNVAINSRHKYCICNTNRRISFTIQVGLLSHDLKSTTQEHPGFVEAKGSKEGFYDLTLINFYPNSGCYPVYAFTYIKGDCSACINENGSVTIK